MILRNGRLLGSDSVSIDFNNASNEWRKNKIPYGEGMFYYIIDSK